MKKIKRTSLVDQVSAAILELIEEQNLAPNDKLPTTANLEELFGVSRPVIREALQNLEGQGVVQVIKGVGTIVKPINSDILQSFLHRAVALDNHSIKDILELRHGIEVQAASLAAERRTDQDVTALDNLLVTMEQHIFDSEKYTEFDLQFHLLIAQATQNKILLLFIESIRDVMRDTIRRGLEFRLTDDELRAVHASHVEIVNYIKGQDITGASEAMSYHFTDAIRAIFTESEENE